MMPVAALLGLASFSTANAAEPVLLPDFTPPGPNDWAVTAMVQQLVVDRLVSDGMIVLTSDVAGRVVPIESMAQCGPSPTCPQDVLPRIPARMATVVTLTRAGSTMIGQVDLYGVGQATPINSVQVPVVPGNEHMFALEVSKATQGLLAQVGPSPDSVLLAAARLIAGQVPTGAPAPMPAPVITQAPSPSPVPTGPPPPLVDLDSEEGGFVGGPAPAPTPVPTTAPAPVGTTPPPVPRVPVKKGDGSTPHTGPLGPILEDTGVHERHLLGSEQAFRKSGLDPRDWVFKQTPHAGRLTVQVGAALGIGDVDRKATTLVLLQDGNQIDSIYEEGPDAARRVRGDVFVGYAPATMVDLGVTLGLQYSGRDILFQRVDRDVDGTERPQAAVPSDTLQAIQFYMQPRVRAYIVPLGPAKPYLFTGLDVRFQDRYRVQNQGLQYALPDTAWVTPGWVGGGGLMIDPGPIVGLYVEGSYIRHFGPQAGITRQTSLAAWNPPYTAVPETYHMTIGLGGGVQFRL
ncbi:MAG: hypothetical protein KC621_23380 [Myxococcales bacterium]|nr:hypothetical protein [Myxococcales bacterium]